jgi:DNA-binding response OmpR family regulator
VGNPAVSEIIRFRLQRDGFQVEACRDAGSVLRVLDGRDFSVAILDAHLPGQQDLGLLQTLRAQTGSRRLPVLLLTAPGEEQMLSRGFELGVDDYIVEPFSPMELLTRVRSLVRRG